MNGFSSFNRESGKEWPVAGGGEGEVPYVLFRYACDGFSAIGRRAWGATIPPLIVVFPLSPSSFISATHT